MTEDIVFTKDVPLSQNELKVIVGILSRIQLNLADAAIVLPIVDKVKNFIDPVEEPSESALITN